MSKRTKAARDAILTALAEGNWKATAARLGGMSARALNEWIAGDDSMRAAVEAAQAFAESKALEVVKTAARSDPKWAAWYLEKRHLWGKRDEDGNAQGPKRPGQGDEGGLPQIGGAREIWFEKEEGDDA